MERNYVKSAEFRAWFDKEVGIDPRPAALKMEAAQVVARLDEMLQESVTLRRTDVLMFSDSSDQLEVERKFIADCNRIKAEREMYRLELERHHKMIRCGRIMLAYMFFVCVLAGVIWLVAK